MAALVVFFFGMQVDLGTLSVVNPLDTGDLLQNTTESLQLIINELFALPRRSSPDGVLVQLPQSLLVPRFKKLASQKLPTRWEKFAAAKGIQKVKKTRVEYDNERQAYRPTWGYKNQGVSNDLGDWIKEVPDNQDVLVDDSKDVKKQNVAKNEMQQRRNKQEAMAQTKGQDHRAFKRAHLEQAIISSKTSTASLGRFDEKIKNDNVKVRRMKQQV